MENEKIIDTDHFSEQLRGRGLNLKEKSVLITQFSTSSQESDLTLPPNCGGYGRIHHFHKISKTAFPNNPLPSSPAEYYLGRKLGDVVKVQVFQNAICSWRCWYCFVDYKLLSGNPKYSAFKTANDLIDLYLAEPYKCPIIDLSGGQPDLVPEWAFWFAKALKERALDKQVYLWSDDNLSNEYLWQFLTSDQLHEFSTMSNYGRVGCFKGFDSLSFSFNTTASPVLFDRQFHIMKRLIDTGFDMYGYITLTSPTAKDIKSKMSILFDRLQEEVHPLFPLRTIPLEIQEFTPTRQRMRKDHKLSIDIQKEAIIAWKDELLNRFSIHELNKDITEHQLQ